MALEIGIEQAGQVTIAAPRGRLDTVGTPLFESRITTLIRAGTGHLLIDLSEVHFVISMGIRALLIAADGIAGRGGRFAVCGMSAEVSHVFDVAGIGRMLTICASRDEALIQAG